MNQPLLHPGFISSLDDKHNSSEMDDIISDLNKATIQEMLWGVMNISDIRTDEPLTSEQLDMIHCIYVIAKKVASKIVSGELTFEPKSKMQQNIEWLILLGANRLKEAVVKHVSWWSS